MKINIIIMYGDVMGLRGNIKAISKIMLILLIVVSAIIGGIVSYAFTIAYYANIPEETVLAVTNIYINPENVHSFIVTVLNPSYSPGDANVTRIALSLKNGAQLYEVVNTEPSIKSGLKIQRGESINITCIEVEKDDKILKFGEFVGIFAGERVLVHVFAEGSPAANREICLPYVKLEITADFNPRLSFKKFNITLTNNPRSEVNLTITNLNLGITFEDVYPDFRANSVMLPRGETVCFRFNGSWHGYTSFMLEVQTAQRYIFRKEIKMGMVHAAVLAANFCEDDTSSFNVTVYNFAESANPVNVKSITCTLENGSVLVFDCGFAEIRPNSTQQFKFSWNWREYRGKNVTIVAHFTQDFATLERKVQTPPPVIVRVLNAANTFNLRDKKGFNITILNHASSLEAVNITKMVIKRTGVELSIIDGVIGSGVNKTFHCSFNWTCFLNDYGRNLTLTVYAVANKTLKEYTFDFSFTLPVAELNVIAVEHALIGGVGYLNLTLRNMEFSVWNLTLSKVAISVQGSAESFEYLFPKGQIFLGVGCEATLLCPFNWQRYVGRSLTVTVVTEELVEASISYTIT